MKNASGGDIFCKKMTGDKQYKWKNRTGHGADLS
jgi:hypothetical protein